MWIAFSAISSIAPIWRWLRRRRIQSWPIAPAQTESTTIEPPKNFRFRKNAQSYLAQIHYSYSISGERFHGIYERECGTSEEALDFLRALENQPTTVHYSPKNHGSSYMDEEAVELLLQRRDPIPYSETYTAKAGDRVPAWVAPFLAFFMALAGIGFLASLWVHLIALTGHTPKPESLLWIMHLGVFVVFIPAILVTIRRVGSSGRKNYWKLALSGTPDWMRYLVYAATGYAVLNFVFISGSLPSSGSKGMTAETWRLFSGHWIAFYCASFALLYAALFSRRSETA